jgi:hypothetical protein
MNEIHYIEFTFITGGKPLSATFVLNTRFDDGIVKRIMVEKGTTDGLQDVYIESDDWRHHYPDVKIALIKYNLWQ